VRTTELCLVWFVKTDEYVPQPHWIMFEATKKLVDNPQFLSSEREASLAKPARRRNLRTQFVIRPAGQKDGDSSRIVAEPYPRCSERPSSKQDAAGTNLNPNAGRPTDCRERRTKSRRLGSLRERRFCCRNLVTGIVSRPAIAGIRVSQPDPTLLHPLPAGIVSVGARTRSVTANDQRHPCVLPFLAKQLDWPGIFGGIRSNQLITPQNSCSARKCLISSHCGSRLP